MAAVQQPVPERHIGYLGLDASSLRADIGGEEDWFRRTVVVDGTDSLCGWLLAQGDAGRGRVWWWGPFLTDAAWRTQADALYAAAAGLAGGEEELAPDDRNTRVARWAERHGFHPNEASAALSYRGAGFGSSAGTRSLATDERATVAELHDRLFPGTHTTGAALVAADDPRLVVVVDGRLAGYAAVEVQSDGTGYIDYLGVHPAWRRRGIGRRLAMDATDCLLARGATTVHLTVRADNAGARALYASLGFTHERLIRPFRKGFTLA